VVCRSVGRSVTVVNPAKTSEPIDMPVVSRTRVGPMNHVLHGGPDLPTGRGNFEGGGRPVVKYRDTLRLTVQKRLNRSRYRLGYGLGWAQGTIIRLGSRSDHGNGQF